MRKSVLVLGLLLSTWLTASPNVQNDSLNINEDLPVKMEKSVVRTEMLKARWVTIQLQHDKDLDTKKGLKLLKELKPIVSKIEKEIRYQEIIK